MNSLRLIFAATLAFPCSNALAGASEWHKVDGASVRLVTEGAPDASGALRGALEIKLQPGWKTYWRDPGASGVPPTLEPSAGKVTVDYPAPSRFDDGHGAWAGYDAPVSFALTFQVPAATRADSLVVDAFLGVCETICIPVQAEFSVPLTDDTGHAAIVAQAFAALPSTAKPDIGLGSLQAIREEIVVEAILPHGTSAKDLFVAGDDEVSLGAPRAEARADGGTRFSIPVLYGFEKLAHVELPYTLVTSTGAISGVLSLP